MRRLVTILAVLALPLLACAPAAAAHHHPAAPTATSHNWIENAYTTHVLNGSYPTNAGYFYNRAGSYGTGSSTSANPILDGFATTPVLRYTSEAQFASDLAGGVIPNTTWPAGSWVEYDNEQWADTPVAEQQAPDQYMEAFGTAAHGAGFKVFMTPARDLGNVDTECPKNAGEDNNGWYLRCDIAKWAVVNGDGVVVQDQANTLTATTYQSLFNGAYTDAQAGNVNAWVDSELSDGYGTPAQAYAAGNALNRTKCAGFFVHVANSDLSWEDQTLTQFKNGGW